MKPTIQCLAAIFALALLPTLCLARLESQAKTLKPHNIFDSDMVLQRGKPIKIWEQQKARAKSKGAPEPPRPELENLPAPNIHFGFFFLITA